LVAELRNLFVETYSTKTSGDARPQPGACASFASDGVAKNLSHFLLSAAAVATSAALKLLLDIIVELANQKLSHSVDVPR